MTSPKRLSQEEQGGSARRRGWPLVAAALLVAAAGAGGWWTYRTIVALRAERDQLTAQVRALEDTVASFIRGPRTRLVQIPVSTGGRVGAVTIFADSAGQRWLVRCDGLAPNAPDQAYQLWFVTDRGTEPAAVIPLHAERAMVLALKWPGSSEGPRGGPGARVLGAAMTIEPRTGSPEPHGPVVFKVEL